MAGASHRVPAFLGYIHRSGSVELQVTRKNTLTEHTLTLPDFHFGVFNFYKFLIIMAKHPKRLSGMKIP